MDGGWTPLPTRPQRYCDPASLVTTRFVIHFHSCFHTDGWWGKYNAIKHDATLMAQWEGFYWIFFALYFVVSIGTGAFLFKNLVIAGKKICHYRAVLVKGL